MDQKTRLQFVYFSSRLELRPTQTQITITVRIDYALVDIYSERAQCHIMLAVANSAEHKAFSRTVEVCRFRGKIVIPDKERDLYWKKYTISISNRWACMFALEMAN